MIRLGAQLEGRPCRVLCPNMKVRTTPEGLYAYPDVSLVCGDPRFHDDRRDVLVNPTVIIEILSPSTEAYDRGEKFSRYRQIDTLRDYVLIAQGHPLIEHYERRGDASWVYLAVNDLAGAISISSIDCTLRLVDVYDRITFPTTAPTPVTDAVKG